MAMINCRKCGSPAALGDEKCPHCDKPSPYLDEADMERAAHRSSFRYERIGVTDSIQLSGFLGIVGTLLCATGIGAIIGIPFLLIAAVMFFVGPFMKTGSVKGHCPYCRNYIEANFPKAGITCSACLKRFTIRDGDIIPADD